MPAPSAGGTLCSLSLVWLDGALLTLRFYVAITLEMPTRFFPYPNLACSGDIYMPGGYC